MAIPRYLVLMPVLPSRPPERNPSQPTSVLQGPVGNLPAHLPAVSDNTAEPREGHVRCGDECAFRGRTRKEAVAHRFGRRTKLAVNTTEAAIQAALAGVGIIRVLSYQVFDQLRSGALQELLAEFAPEPLPMNVLHAADPCR